MILSTAVTTNHQSTKLCVRCNKILPVEDFRKWSRSKNGLCGWCKPCVRRWQREWRIKNPERARARQSRSYKKRALSNGGRAKILLYNTKKRAEKYRMPFELTFEWVLQKINSGICEVTGTPFVMEPRDKRFKYRICPFSPSIDRACPDLGYTLANSRVVIWMYNLAKSSYTDDDVLRMAIHLAHRNASE